VIGLLAVAVVVRSFPAARTAGALFTVPSDPCSLLTVAEVEQASGGHVTGTRQLTNSDYPIGTPSPGPLPCAYETDSPFGTFIVATDANGTTNFGTVRSEDPSNVPLSGLGDEAFAGDRNSVWVRIGDTYFSITAQRRPGDETVAMLTTLAQVALAPGGSQAAPSTVPHVTVSKTATFDLAQLGGLAAAEEAYGSLWLGVSTESGDTQIVRADPTTGKTEHVFPVEGWSPSEWGGKGIAIGGGKVWIPERRNGHSTIVRIDPATDEAVTLEVSADTIADLAYGSDGMLWANVGTGDGKAIAEIDPASGEILQMWPFTADWANEICEARGSVWVHEMATSNSTVHGGWLSRIVPGAAPHVETGGTFAGPTCSEDAVWTAVHGDAKAVNLAGGIAKVDPSTGSVMGSWSTPPIGYDIALDGLGGVWFLTVRSDGQVERLNPSTGSVDAAESVSGTPIFISSSPGTVWVGTYEGQLIRLDVASTTR
jgi:hypothetical protein